ncbi:MAG: response regulator [Planctomycetales bacterium]
MSTKGAGWPRRRCEDEARAMLQTEDFDLCFFDMRLPGQAGVEGFLELCDLMPRDRVVIITEFGRDQKVDDAVRRGAWAVLDEPLAWSRVLQHVKRVAQV